MPELYIGLMSGTSLDAIDAVLVDFSADEMKLLQTCSYPLDESLREAVRNVAGDPGGTDARRLAILDHDFGQAFALAVNALIEQSDVNRASIEAIGSPGQTLLHSPDSRPPFSLQAGDPNVIAAQTGIRTVADFRRADMAAGGQGAPLVPAFHAGFFRDEGRDRAVLNIGGIANLTLLPADDTRPVAGFDTGPGNCLLDVWASRHLRTPMDTNGAWAASGRIDDRLLESMRAEPFFTRAPPKSTGREYFNPGWLEGHIARQPGPPAPVDVQATLGALTATTVADALHAHAADYRQLLVCGGGVHNEELMRLLRGGLPGWNTASTVDYGLDPDWVEATAFAWLARRAIHGLPGNLPEATGAKCPAVLGGIYAPGA